jgi:hypothetical protein
MPAKKRQHFVPQTYLRRFSIDENGKQIGLYNLQADKIVTMAPIKGQCAKNYIYTQPEDHGLEDALSEFESIYARTVKAVEHGQRIDEHVAYVLMEFLSLQYFRTYKSMEIMRNMEFDMHELMYEGKPVEMPDISQTDRQFMRNALQQYTSIKPYLQDLKVAVLYNDTGKLFTTSDNPAININPFHTQCLNSRNFGLGSSGAIFALPLTPQYLLVAYDGKIYTLPKDKIFLGKISKPHDVQVFNELQFINCDKNVFFSNLKDFERTKRKALTNLKFTKPLEYIIDVFVQDAKGDALLREDGGYTRWRRAHYQERIKAQQTLQSVSYLGIKPAHYPSVFQYRQKRQYHYDGSAAGYVRPDVARMRAKKG